MAIIAAIMLRLMNKLPDMHLSVLKTAAGIANLAEISAFQSVMVAGVCSKIVHDVWSV